MRLRRLWLGNYYNLKDVEIEFDSNSRLLYDSTSIRFFIGLNGSGKSNALTAIGLIFSHLAADASPGIEFDIEYELRDQVVRITSDHTRVPSAKLSDKLQPIDALLMVRRISERAWDRAHIRKAWASSGGETTPGRIVGYSTGPASGLHWALTESIVCLVRERVSLLAQEQYPDNEEKRKDFFESELHRQKRVYLDNPTTLFLNSEDALCAVLPLLVHTGPIDSLESATYQNSRQTILERVGLDTDDPIAAFSLRVSGAWDEAVGIDSDRHTRLSRLLDKAKVRMPIEREAEMDIDTPNDFYAVFDVSTVIQNWLRDGDEETMVLPKAIPEVIPKVLPEETKRKLPMYETPLAFFEDLLSWLRIGALQQVRLVIKKKGIAPLLPQDALSDGEYLFLGRFALLLMLKDIPECLMLLDEPETHFNDHWKVELVNDIYELLKPTRKQKHRARRVRNEVIIATHSDLTLTDADPRQVYHFKESEKLADDKSSRQIEVIPPAVSPFAANRAQISQALFETGGGTGRFATREVDRVIESGSRKQVKELLQATGPGYARFRLRDRLLELEQTEAKEQEDAPSD